MYSTGAARRRNLSVPPAPGGAIGSGEPRGLAEDERHDGGGVHQILPPQITAALVRRRFESTALHGRRPPLRSPLPGLRIRLPFAWRPSVRGRGRRECSCAMVPLPETSRVALSSVAFRHLWFVAWGPMAATSCPARGPHSILRTPPEEPEPRRNCRTPAIRPQPSGKDRGSSSSSARSVGGSRPREYGALLRERAGRRAQRSDRRSAPKDR